MSLQGVPYRANVCIILGKYIFPCQSGNASHELLNFLMLVLANCSLRIEVGFLYSYVSVPEMPESSLPVTTIPVQGPQGRSMQRTAAKW